MAVADLVVEAEDTGVSSIHACLMNPFSACMEDQGTLQGTLAPAGPRGTGSTLSRCHLSQCPPYLGLEGLGFWLHLCRQHSP